MSESKSPPPLVHVAPNRTNTLVVFRPVRRIVLSGYFHDASAILLPWRPWQGGSGASTVRHRPREQDLCPPVRADIESRERSHAAVACTGRQSHAIPILAAFLWYVDAHEPARHLVAGHCSPSGSNSSNETLSRARAQLVRSLLVGDVEAYVEAASSHHAEADDEVLLEFAASRYGWGTAKPGPGFAAESRSQRVERYQASYNQEFGASIAVDGIVGPQTRGSYFRLMEHQLAFRVGGDERLASLRSVFAARAQDAAEMVLACGEEIAPASHEVQPASSSHRPLIPDLRRAELLLFDANAGFGHITGPEAVYANPSVRILELPWAHVQPRERLPASSDRFALRDVQPLPTPETLRHAPVELPFARFRVDPDDPFSHLEGLRGVPGGSRVP